MPSSTLCRRRWTFPLQRELIRDTEEELEREADDNGPFAALAFKIMADPFVGKLAFVRVYSGTLKSGSYVLQLHKGKARARRAYPADACKPPRRRSTRSMQVISRPLSACKDVGTGDTLCDDKQPDCSGIHGIPGTGYPVAIEPKTKAGQEKMSIALGKLAEEDPTFRAYTDEETGQTIIAGMGELHLGYHCRPSAARI